MILSRIFFFFFFHFFCDHVSSYHYLIEYPLLIKYRFCSLNIYLFIISFTRREKRYLFISCSMAQSLSPLSLSCPINTFPQALNTLTTLNYTDRGFFAYCVCILKLWKYKLMLTRGLVSEISVFDSVGKFLFCYMQCEKKIKNKM